MIENNEKIYFTNITLFTTALCNLNCGYCYICKDATGCLKQIDDDLAKDFENGSQIKQVYDVDPEADKHIKHITLWGGEPFLHIERFIDHFEEYVEAFPNFNELDTSTNFTLPNQVESLKRLFDTIIEHYHGNQKFHFDLQVSIDGPEEMNDLGRGKGVTQKFLKNFRDLCELEFDDSKIDLYVHTKPTFSKPTFHFVDTPEKAYEWFEFFDREMYQPYKNRKTRKWCFLPCLFNYATPAEWTKDDGLEVAKIYRSIQEVTPRIKQLDGWIPNYETYIPSVEFLLGRLRDDNSFNKKKCLDCSKPFCGGGCGSFSHVVVPIHDGKYTMCHRGMFDDYVDYHNNMKDHADMNGLAAKYVQTNNESAWIYDKDQFLNLKKTFDNLILYPHQIFYTDYVKFVYEYAKAGIIDEKWTDMSKIDKTIAIFVDKSCCLQDSYIITGSWITSNPLEIPLWYNGAMDVVEEEIDRIMAERGIV